MNRLASIKEALHTRRWQRRLHIARYVFVCASFFLLDIWLRFATRDIGKHSLLYIPANVFSVFWSMIFAAVSLAMPKRTAGRIAYAVLYYAAAVYVVVQYGYYRLMGSFLYFSDFLYAGEGIGYLSYVEKILSPGFAVQVLLIIAVGLVGAAVFPAPERDRLPLRTLGKAMLAGVLGVALTPLLYGTYNETKWNAYKSPAFQYRKFINATADLELTGTYQFVFKNAVMAVQDTGVFEDEEKEDASVQKIEDFFAARPAHEDNEMTGLFAGRNVIVVMMESMDDWLITEDDTPTLYWLREHGIDFTHMYTPEYASGYTFNTEFAAHTGVYPYTNSNAAYGLPGNDFPYALPHLFGGSQYRVNSYHRSEADFYNRGMMHAAFGYERYHSYFDYTIDGDNAVSQDNDTFLTRCPELWEDMLTGEPFMDFVITYSGHLPYDDLEEELTQEALALHPEYAVEPLTELSVLKAKIRLTDDMFAELLARLEEEGLLENTVIVAFGDHYCYGFSDEEYLQSASEAAGNAILQHTPFFIWSADGEPLKVEKTIQTIDIMPTLANLFGLPVPREVMGRDAFDPAYEGYAVFPDGTWVHNGTYVISGQVQWNEDGLSEEDIERMNNYVYTSYEVNDLILDTDYYRAAREGVQEPTDGGVEAD